MKYEYFQHCFTRKREKNVIIIIFFSVAPIQNRTSECPLHYNLLGDDCYFVSSIKLTWKEAREVCKRESNGDLISVHSPVEQGKIVTAQNNPYRKVRSYTVRGLRFCGRKTILHGTRTRARIGVRMGHFLMVITTSVIMMVSPLDVLEH